MFNVLCLCVNNEPPRELGRSEPEGKVGLLVQLVLCMDSVGRGMRGVGGRGMRAGVGGGE